MFGEDPDNEQDGDEDQGAEGEDDEEGLRYLGVCQDQEDSLFLIF